MAERAGQFLCRAGRGLGGLPGIRSPGPEFSEPGGGTYQLEQIPLTAAGLGAIDLKPTAIAGLLRDAVAASRDLFTLPDLRSGPALRMGGSGVVRCRP